MAVFLRPRLPEKVRQAASGTRDVSRDGSIFEWRAAATTDTRSSRKRKHDDDDDDDDLGQPHDTPPIPVHLAKVVKADYWDEIAQTRTIDHGYLDPDFTDKRLMAYYRNSAGPNANLEVVKYSRLDPTENGHGQGTGKAAPSFLGSKEQAVAAGYRTSILYSRCDGRKQVELRLDRTVASGTIDHERERMKRRISAALHQLEQLKQKGGLMTIISHRIERISSHREKVLLALSLSPPLSLPLHRRFDWPRAPPPDVVGDYEKAFSSWDQAMAKSIPSYAANMYGKKRRWYKDRWKAPERVPVPVPVPVPLPVPTPAPASASAPTSDSSKRDGDGGERSGLKGWKGAVATVRLPKKDSKLATSREAGLCIPVR